MFYHDYTKLILVSGIYIFSFVCFQNNIQLSPEGEVNSGGYVVVQFLLWNNLFLNWDKIVLTGTILICTGAKTMKIV